MRSLEELRTEIDGINVYPVADSDTGSNLLHTIAAANIALTERRDVTTAGQALRVLASGAVAAARGNSGVILSQFLRGLADAAGDAARLDGPALASALRRADELATGAVARPVAGTMLSVLHAVGTAVTSNNDGNSDGSHGSATGSSRDGEVGTLDDVARTAARTAAEALAETPRQLAALAAAGVVDAGGRGLVAVFDALAAVVAGEAAPEHAVTVPSVVPAPQAWEVMYLLSDLPADAEESALLQLRRDLAELGDSVTVAGDGDGNHAVHVHCGDIGAALEAGLRHGRPHRVRVEPLMTPAPPEGAAGDRAVVVVLRGRGVVDLVAGEGLPVLAADDDPSVEQLLGLVGETAAGHVTVVPGEVDLTAVAERAANHPVLADRDVVVVPCASPVQTLAALAVHDPERRAGADVVAMAEAAAATRRGDIVIAGEDAITWVGHAHAGDVLGLVDGEVVRIGAPDRIVETALEVLTRMLAVGGELVTVLTGVDAPDRIEEILTEHLRAAHPEVELVCYYGGQADAVLLMGVE
ncbi:dihydroxyacetone kinase [Saccharomonospora sp. CUA-673]|nr:dihydroxyacetone kinase [Saccharomonospora sp. CUA-673]